ncbi:ribose transport system permease protein [Salinihabitans flavidus]|uniref:Ribose transport system permease protein n=1 Tax=Salinihabitans flavidus TaxID=569882 RepID=A0A1H8PAZ8_9RHOB|nr:ABC transporter permease [Salinihabitans flavidus]SEO39112.1 ribose transport system permease protein [Salinihabitans flavidus]
MAGNSKTAPFFSSAGSGIFRMPGPQILTVLLSIVGLVVASIFFAPSSITLGAVSGSIPFAAVLAIVGLGQLLVVQQGGFDLSVPGGVSLAVVICAHVPAGDNAVLPYAVGLAICAALATGILNGVMVGVFRVNAVIATIGVNALLYGGVFAVSGGVPILTTPLLQKIVIGTTFGIPHSVYFALAALIVVAFVVKKTVMGRRFEVIGANKTAAAAVGLRVRLHESMAYVYAQLLYCLAGILLAGILREPTAFQGEALLLPSIAVVVLGGTLSGGRGYPLATFIAAIFLNQLSQFALAVGVPYSGQSIIQALALGLGISVHSMQRRFGQRKLT